MFKKLFFGFICATSFLAFLVGSAQAGLNLANGFATGQWYNPDRDGEGFYVEVIGEGDDLQIAVAMYSYDELGNQLWLVGNLQIANGDVVATVPVVLIDGPVWGTAYDPADRNTTEFGNIVVQFPTCDSALFNVNSNVQGLESGPYSLVRLTEIVGMDCVEPPPPDPEEPPPGPPPTDITPGLWTGGGVCFFVNTEGTKIVESDLCDAGKAFNSDIDTGIQIDIDFKPDPDVCNANVNCGGAWPIENKSDPYGTEYSETICVNEAGGIGQIIFDTGTKARVRVYDGTDLDHPDGRFCYGGGEKGIDAAPSQ